MINELQQELASLKMDFAAELDANRSAIAALKQENATLQDILSRTSLQQQLLDGNDAMNATRGRSE